MTRLYHNIVIYIYLSFKVYFEMKIRQNFVKMGIYFFRINAFLHWVLNVLLVIKLHQLLFVVSS